MKLCLLCSARYDDDAKVCEVDGARLVSAGSDDLVGSVVGEKYQIEELIGKGSLGRVYRARKLSDGTLAAVKVLRENLSNDSEALARFKREAQMLSIIEHPNIVALYDFGQTPAGEPYYAAEYLDGKTLATVIQESRCLTVSEAEPIIEQVCEGLAEAHSHGFTHRDVKPSNIMLLPRGEEYHAKLLDFSLAKLPPLAVEDKVTKDGMLRGTPAYMSPEQCQSMEVDHLSDIYSLGVVIFEVLTGLRPFASKNSVITMHQQMNDAPPLMMAVRNDLYFCQEMETLIQECLSKKPANRPQSVEEVLEKFKAACIAQRNVSQMETPPVYYTENVEQINKLSPLEKFKEAEQRRLAANKILSDTPAPELLTGFGNQTGAVEMKDEDLETMRMEARELQAQQRKGAGNLRSYSESDPSSLPSADELNEVTPEDLPTRFVATFSSMMATERGRKILLGILVVVLAVFVLIVLMTAQIPNPEAPPQ